MKRYLHIVVILFLLISCNSPCKKFHDTPVYSVVNEIFEDSLIESDTNFNIIKIVFLKSYVGPTPFVRIINDVDYSEEVNELNMDG